MSTAEQVATLEGVELHEAIRAGIDERTLEILEHRRRTSAVRRRGWLVKRLLVIADVLGLVAAMLLAEAIVTSVTRVGTVGMKLEILALLASLPGWVVIAKLYGLYDRDEARTDHSTADEFAAVFHMVTVCTFLFWAFSRTTKFFDPTPSKLIIFWATAILLVAAARAAARSAARRSISYLQNTLVVGADDVGQLIATKLLQHPEYGANLVGFIDDEPQERSEDLQHVTVLGGLDRLPFVIRLLDVERVVVAFWNGSVEGALEVVRSVRDMNVQVDVVPRLFETLGYNFNLHMIEGLPIVGLPPIGVSRSSAVIKRAFDLTVAGLMLVAGAPLLATIALAVKVTSRGPTLYRHRRVGRAGRPIDVLKFRTMYLAACRGERYGGDAAEATFDRLMSDPRRAREFAESYKLADDPRVTPIGRFLRSSSLDELPQLLNVLRGDLSLVGPRAITDDELPRYGSDVQDLLSVRPGVTGLWQINGRSRLAYRDRVRLDLSYVTGWSLRLDLEILAKTLRALLSQRGAV